VPAHQVSDAQFDDLRATVIALAAHSGLAWRVVDVVNRTGMSSKTLYKYFPSKEALLLDALTRDGRAFTEQVLEAEAASGRTGATVAQAVLDAHTAALQAAPRLAAAMVTALTSGQPGVAPVLARHADTMRSALAAALGGPDAAPQFTGAAELLQQVWFAAIVAWASGIQPPGYVDASVRNAIAQLRQLDQPG
jgi:AcrR family transcriptional regulator